MDKKILVDVYREQIRVALLENNRVAELYIEDDHNQRLIGAIYRGKVQNVLQGMNVAFVDIGLEKNAFLYVGDLNTDTEPFQFKGDDLASHQKISHKNMQIADHLKIGQEITVQIMKEAIGTKGARVSMNITLPGKYLVLLPTMDYIGVSHKIQSEEERFRLREIAKKICPPGIGIIMRTQSEGRQEEEFAEDLNFLLEQWHTVQKNERKGPVPRLLFKDENLLCYIVRDLFSNDISQMLVNDQHAYDTIRNLCGSIAPNLLQKIKLCPADVSLLQKYDVEHTITDVIRRKVWLENGGYIVIDNTEALTVIDVNTGKYVGKDDLNDTILSTNLQAARLIAQQIRLRDIGGIVIIDFIDMNSEEHKQKVIEELKEACKSDRSKVTVLGMTQLGLVELTRKKVKQRLSSLLLKPCPYCNGTGRVFTESVTLAAIEQELREYASQSSAWGFLIEAHPDVVKEWVDEQCKLLYVLSASLQKNLVVKTDANIHIESYHIHPLENKAEYEQYLQNHHDRVYVSQAT